MSIVHAEVRPWVGIEVGRVCCRRRVTSLALSVARWVHNSAMATFSEAPLSCRTAEFPRSGWKSWPVDGEPSHPQRGSSAGTHTPQTRTVCSPLRVISCVGVSRLCVRAPRYPMAPPSTQSPFARYRRYRYQGDVNRLLRGHYSPVMALTDSCADPARLSPPSA